MATPPRRNLVGVRVFPHYTNKNYGQHDKVLKLLGELGIKRISGLLAPGTVSQVGGFYKKAWEQYGIKTWFTVGAPRVTLSTSQWATLTKAVTANKTFIELCSGWNEPNHVRGGGDLPSDWPDTTAAHQKALWKNFKPIGGFGIGTPQLWSGDFARHDADLKKLAPKIEGAYNKVSWHLYPRGTVGTKFVDRFYNTYDSVLQHPDWQVCCTEAGYFTIPPDSNDTGANPVTEAEQAEYWPQHLKLYTDRGDRISIFELLDDPAGGREGYLGIVRADWTKKPAFGTIKRFLAG